MTRKHIWIHCGIVGAFLLLLGMLVALKRVDFYEPIWLLGLLSLPFLLWQAKRGISGLPPVVNLASATLRAFLVILLLMCLADVQYVRHNDRLCVLYLLDRSASIPDYIHEQQIDYVNATAKERGRKDSAGILVFGENASVEVIPQHNLDIERLHSAVSEEYTDLQHAVELATAIFPHDARKKIVLVSDGNENIGDVMKGAEYAAANQVQLDVRPVHYDYPNEISVEQVAVPDRVEKDEAFNLNVHIRSSRQTKARMIVYKNGEILANDIIELQAGDNMRAPSVQVKEAGVHEYEVVVEPLDRKDDVISQNNKSTGYVYIKGASKVLFIAPSEQEVSYLMQACREESLEAEFRLPDNAFTSMQDLQPYDSLVLANVASSYFSESTMQAIKESVANAGMGLIMIGGENSFGAGDWNNTPVEEALPVTMDIKQKKINPKGALVLILHTCEFANGNYWAKEISKEAIRHVNPQDEVGVVYFSWGGGIGGGPSGDQWLFDLTPAEDKAMMFNKISSCEPGDMPSFAPGFELAVKSLKESDAMVKHIIVISDGDPASPRPQDLDAMVELGITVSTVGINPHTQRDTDLLKYIATKTSGRYYFAQDPKVLPRIFVKEAKVVKRSLIFNHEFTPQLAYPTELTKGVLQNEIPSLQAYVATTPKPLSQVPMVSENENQDPILAHWQFGLGKSIAFTSDATSSWGRNWVGWDHYKKFWGQSIRWVSRKSSDTDVDIRTVVEGRKVKVYVDAINDDGEYINGLNIRGTLSDGEESAPLTFRQQGPGIYVAESDKGGVGAQLINVRYEGPGISGSAHHGTVVPYSPEYRVKATNKALLERAAAFTGGRLLDGDNPAMDAVFETTLPAFQSSQSIWEFLLILIVIMLMVDVVLRRVIISAADMRAGWESVLMRLPGKRSAEKDETMSALLAVKKKVADRNKGAAEADAPDAPTTASRKAPRDGAGRIEPTGDFRARLQEQAKSAEAGPVDVAKSGDGKTTSSRGGSGSSAQDSGDDTAGDGDSYTNRLLKAKRRARKDDEDKA